MGLSTRPRRAARALRPRACYSLLTTHYSLLTTRYSLRYQVALVLTLQWLLYLLVTIGSYYKWWVESNQGPGVYSFSSTPTEDLEGPMHQLQQECTWMDQKMSVAGSVPPSPPPANFSGLTLPLLESASGELVEAEPSNILNGAALVRRDGHYPPHTRWSPTPRTPAPAPAPALAPQHRSTAAPQHRSTAAPRRQHALSPPWYASHTSHTHHSRRPHHRTPRGTPRGTEHYRTPQGTTRSPSAAPLAPFEPSPPPPGSPSHPQA